MRVSNPVTAEEANEQSQSFEPFPPGEYDFVVREAVDEISKSSGNEQIKLTLDIFSRTGSKRVVFDYLVNTPGGQWKIRRFAESIGMVREYETGELPTFKLIGKPGRSKIRIKPASGQYSAQNAVQDYIGGASTATPVQRQPAQRQKVAAGDLDDEIPF